MIFSKNLSIAFYSVLFLFYMTTFLFSQQTARQLFQKALYIEEAKGELQEAIDLYQQILNNYPEDRSIVAKAWLHTGLCYEKLGNKKAQNAYQQILNKFPDQQQEVIIARKKLSRLKQLAEEAKKAEKAPLIPKFTKIKIPTELSWFVALSPDGKDLALVSDKKLWKMSITGNLSHDMPGAPIQINTEDVKVEWTGLAWSRDGKWIAFNECPKTTDSLTSQAIYRVSSNGGKTRKIIKSYRDYRTVNYRISLSPNGGNLAFSSVEDDQQHIYTMPVEEGNPLKLTTMQGREPAFSPDGKWIAFVADSGIGRISGDLGLWIVPAQGGTPRLAAEAGKASSPVWSPDGSMIAYLDYTHNQNIFIVQLDQSGQAIGEPFSIDIPEGIDGTWLLTGWSSNNKIGAIFEKHGETNLYSIRKDDGKAVQIAYGGGQPHWSPDGKRIFGVIFSNKETDAWQGLAIASIPAEGGSFTTIPIRSNIKMYIPGFGVGNGVSPDGKTIVFSGKTEKKQPPFLNNCIWTLPVDGGNPEQLTKTVGQTTDMFPCWSPDGKTIAFVRTRIQKIIHTSSNIYILKSNGEEPTPLTTYSDSVSFGPIEWSPDGKFLAYLSRKDNDSVVGNLKLIPADGDGLSRVIGKVKDPHPGIQFAWSPDSKSIALNGPDGKIIKIISIEDGSKVNVKTGLVDSDIGGRLDWSPDGERFVFVGGKGERNEFWLMENFLPLERLAQNRQAEKSKEPVGITIKQVWTGQEVDNMGQVSKNGTYLSFVDWRTADLAIRNLKTKENKRLTNEGSWDAPYHYADVSLITDNGKKVIYSWYNDDENYDLRSISLDNPAPEIIYKPENPEQIFPRLLYANDHKVLVQRFYPKNFWHLASVSIDNGEIRNIKKFKGNFAINLSIDPDENYFAFDFPNNENEGRFDIHLLSVKGNQEIPLVDHPANDRLLGWFPGKNDLLFTSDRSGTTDIWALNIEKNASFKDPQRILSDIGDIQPLGFSNNGTLYFSTKFRRFNAFIMPFDEKTDKLYTDSRKPILGSILDPLWTNDGDSIIYFHREDEPRGTWNYKLAVLDCKTGNRKQLAAHINGQGPPRLSPDGRSVLIFGMDKTKLNGEDYKGGIYNVDIVSGMVSEIKVSEDISRSYCVEWDGEGKNVFYRSKNKIIQHNIKTGLENVLYEDKHLKIMSILQKSWDGDHLLFDVQENDTLKHLLIIPVTGGEPRILCSFNAGTTPIMYKKMTFSTEGDNIYFSVNDPKAGSVIWKIPKEGGSPKKIWYTKNRIGGLSFHPNGTKMAISLYEAQVEIRKIENLKQMIEKIYSHNE